VGQGQPLPARAEGAGEADTQVDAEAAQVSAVAGSVPHARRGSDAHDEHDLRPAQQHPVQRFGTRRTQRSGLRRRPTGHGREKERW
jgi:hypothetical protein